MFINLCTSQFCARYDETVRSFPNRREDSWVYLTWKEATLWLQKCLKWHRGAPRRRLSVPKTFPPLIPTPLSSKTVREKQSNPLPPSKFQTPSPSSILLRPPPFPHHSSRADKAVSEHPRTLRFPDFFQGETFLLFYPTPHKSARIEGVEETLRSISKKKPEKAMRFHFFCPGDFRFLI